jgi:hypothetical protein
MPLYRAYLMENGHVWTAIDLTCANDTDAKRQAAGLGNDRDVELWRGDRKIALLRTRRNVSAGTFSAGVVDEGALPMKRLARRSIE